MREEFVKMIKAIVIIFSVILLFLYFRDDFQSFIDEYRMNRYIKKEKELRKNDVPNNVTRGIHPKRDTVKIDTVKK